MDEKGKSVSQAPYQTQKRRAERVALLGSYPVHHSAKHQTKKAPKCGEVIILAGEKFPHIHDAAICSLFHVGVVEFESAF